MVELSCAQRAWDQEPRAGIHRALGREDEEGGPRKPQRSEACTTGSYMWQYQPLDEGLVDHEGRRKDRLVEGRSLQGQSAAQTAQTLLEIWPMFLLTDVDCASDLMS